MRTAPLVVPAFVVLSACSFIENFDGYASTPDAGSVASDAAPDALATVDAASDASGAFDASRDAAIDGGVAADGSTSFDAAATDSSSSDAGAPVAHVYVVGGQTGATAGSSDVLSAPAYADGSLGAWTATTSLPVGVSAQGTTTQGGAIFVMGGTPDGTTALTSVYSAQPSAPGTIDSWATQTPMSTNRFGLGAAASSTRIYAIGGHDSSGALAGVEGASPSAGGAVSGWLSYSVLPTASDLGAACFYNGYVYVAVGSDDGTAAGASSTVFAAAITFDGSLGLWMSANLMTPRRGATCAVVGARLYVLGGQDTSGNYYGDVQWAPIAGDGSLGSWTETTGFAPSRFEHATVTIGSYVYVIGGVGSAGLLSDVQVAEVGFDGSITSWNAATSLPAGRALHGAVAF